MESNDLLMVAGAGALDTAAYIWAGLPLALVVLAVALIFFAHTMNPVVLRLPKRTKPAPEPKEEARSVYTNLELGKSPVTLANCAVCLKDYERGTEHECKR